MVKATLQPACLIWARKRAGLSVPDLAEKLKVREEKVAAWEQTGELTLSHVEKLAKATHTPLGYLFMSEPPVDELPIKDFRTINAQNILQPSVNLLDIVNDALSRQDWYRDYMLANRWSALPFVGSIEVSNDIMGSAKQIRNVIGWTTELSTQSSSWEDALSRHIYTVDVAGILVMRSGIVANDTHRALSVDEFRGFALSDDYAPLIFINSKDAKAAQLFTLAHELVHIWLGLSGVSNLDRTYPSEIGVERFCNAVAAELLVPTEELKAQWAVVKATTNPIAQAAKHFRVSSLVILRRLRDVGYVSYKEFEHHYAEELKNFSPRASTPGGGDFYRTLNSRLGKRFVSALIESTLEGETPYREAFRLLGVKDAEKVHKLASMLEGSA